MKTIKRTFRKFVLRKLIKWCELRKKKLDVKTDRYHEIIIKKIINGEGELAISKLLIKRNEAYNEIFKLITWKSKLRRALARA